MNLKMAMVVTAFVSMGGKGAVKAHLHQQTTSIMCTHSLNKQDESGYPSQLLAMGFLFVIMPHLMHPLKHKLEFS